jgi:hypothetical protein
MTPFSGKRRSKEKENPSRLSKKRERGRRPSTVILSVAPAERMLDDEDQERYPHHH